MPSVSSVRTRAAPPYVFPCFPYGASPIHSRASHPPALCPTTQTSRSVLVPTDATQVSMASSIGVKSAPASVGNHMSRVTGTTVTDANVFSSSSARAMPRYRAAPLRKPGTTTTCAGDDDDGEDGAFVDARSGPAAARVTRVRGCRDAGARRRWHRYAALGGAARVGTADIAPPPSSRRLEWIEPDNPVNHIVFRCARPVATRDLDSLLY